MSTSSSDTLQENKAIASQKSGNFLQGIMAVIIVILADYIVLMHFRAGDAGDLGLSVIRSALENCGEATTLRAYFEAVADRQEKSWVPGRSRKFAIIFRGTVDCGFDMRRARITVFAGEKRVEVNLPHCEIQRVWLNLESGDRAGIKVYDQQAGIFAPNLTLDEQNEVVAESLQKIRQKAYQDWDVILKAEENAARLYKSFLAPFNYTVSVVFTDDESRLGVPLDERSDTMKGGGALIIHTAKE